MTSKYTIHSWPSIIGGTVAALGASSLLIADGLKHGFALEHALAPVCIGLTVLAGHMIMQATKEGKILSAVGLMIIALAGSGLIVYQSMGRQAATRDAQTVVASAQMDARQDLKTELKRSQAMLADAQKAVDDETTNGGCGKVCKGKMVSVTVYQNAIDGIEAKLAKTPPVAVDPRADRIAGVATILGATMGADAIKALVALFEPFALPLFLELSSIFMFGFGVRHVHVATAAIDRPAMQALDFMNTTKDKEIEELKKLLHLAGQALNNKDLAERAGVTPSEMSKRVNKAVLAGVVARHKVGKECQITVH